MQKLQIKKSFEKIYWTPRGNMFTKSKMFTKAYNIFESILVKVFDNMTPLIQKNVRDLSCLRRTPEILKLIRTWDYHLRKAKQSGNDNNWQQCRQCRNTVNSSIRKSKVTYKKILLEENAKNPKQFWDLIKKLYPSKENASSIFSALEVDGKLETTKQGIASTCFKYFATCAEKLCSSLQRKWSRPCKFLFQVWQYCRNEILILLNKLMVSFGFEGERDEAPCGTKIIKSTRSW